MTDGTPSTWIMEHLSGTRAMRRQDATRSEELSRQVRAGIGGPDREPDRCQRCGRAKPRASLLASCENCREKDARAKRKKAERESKAEREARLAQRRAEEKARRAKLRAAGDSRDAERKAKARQAEKEQRARQRQAQTALRRLEARGIVLKGAGT